MILIPSGLEQSFYLISPYTGSGIEAGLAEWVLSSLSMGSARSVQPAAGLVWWVQTVSLRRLLLVGMTRSWAPLLPCTAPWSPMLPSTPIRLPTQQPLGFQEKGPGNWQSVGPEPTTGMSWHLLLAGEASSDSKRGTVSKNWWPLLSSVSSIVWACWEQNMCFTDLCIAGSKTSQKTQVRKVKKCSQNLDPWKLLSSYTSFGLSPSQLPDTWKDKQTKKLPQSCL